MAYYLRSFRCLRSVAVSVYLVAFFSSALTAFAQDTRATSPDLIVVNGKIYTVNEKQPWAEALAVRDGKILAVGKLHDIEKLKAPNTKIIDAQKRLVLPGFADCHVHFMDGAISLGRVNVEDAKTIAEIQQQVKAFAAAHPDAPWVLGRGWNYSTFPGGLPTRKMLDEVVPDRPAYLEGFDGHSYWANSKALEAAHIDRNTPDPPNGAIVHDENGEPSGALKESASDLVDKVIPQLTREERINILRIGLHEANRLGVTRIHSAGGDFQYLDLYDDLRRKGELTARFYIAYFLDPPELTPDAISKIEAARKTYADDWISGGAVKTMLDGVVESHTAAMLTPYSDDASVSGKLFWDPAKYKAAVQELDHRGLQIFTHAIGDAAVRLALDAYADAKHANQSKDSRDRIEHIETITATDIPRFGREGVIASYQPLHAYPDDDTLKVWARNAGPDRASRAWTWHSVRASGGQLAFGSDWPVVTLNPWYGLQNAVTRETADGKPAGGWLPNERVTLPQAIEAYTLGAAYAGKREKNEGSLEPGKLADLIILSQNLFDVDPMKFRQTQVMLTIVGGKVVYRSPSWTDSTPKSAEVKQ